ncbi:hypothetical protein BDV39DRAFT_105353 [Aspergillus sergii]|uniref:Uncharacterized protein n=1 Tax=Aspergillus sergii TaxID=1034303 RepID=A0A5N6WWK1_9EURO|nr:hypothetical protein BDV39DRAFT_105353 [Aspergillus sergii]
MLLISPQYTIHDLKKSRFFGLESRALALGVASLSLLLPLFSFTTRFGLESLLPLLFPVPVSHGRVRGILSDVR